MDKREGAQSRRAVPRDERVPAHRPAEPSRRDVVGVGAFDQIRQRRRLAKHAEVFRRDDDTLVTESFIRIVLLRGGMQQNERLRLTRQIS